MPATGPKLARTALATPQLQLRWLCDHHKDRARATLGDQDEVRITTCSDEVLGDPAVAAVAIATPAGTHFELARTALQAGKHVLVEKPPTVTAAESEELARLARQYGLTLMCDHTFCYTPAAQQIREIIRSGEAGEIQFVDSVRVNLGLVQPDVDVIWDLAPHDLSILDFVLPADTRPVAVAAQSADPVGAGRACLAHLYVWLSTGALVHVNVSWLSPTKIRTMTLGGTRRTIVWDDMDARAPVTVYDRGVDRVPDCASGGRPVGRHLPHVARSTSPTCPTARHCSQSCPSLPRRSRSVAPPSPTGMPGCACWPCSRPPHGAPPQAASASPSKSMLIRHLLPAWYRYPPVWVLRCGPLRRRAAGPRRRAARDSPP